MSLAEVSAALSSRGIPAVLVDPLLAAYEEAKRRFHLGDHRPQAVEGGRFCEAAFRVLELLSGGSFTPLGDPTFKTATVTNRLEKDSSLDDTLRFHIPRSLRVIYDIRNKRDTGHLGSGSVNPNLMDATLVVGIMDWVVAELVRFCGGLPSEKASRLVADLVTKEVPVIEEINGQVVCLASISLSDRILVLLYRAGQNTGLAIDDLQAQLRHGNRGNLLRGVRSQDDKRRVLLHPTTKTAHITTLGMKHVEAERLLEHRSEESVK